MARSNKKANNLHGNGNPYNYIIEYELDSVHLKKHLLNFINEIENNQVRTNRTIGGFLNNYHVYKNIH